MDVPGANDPKMDALVTSYAQIMYAQLGVAAWERFQILDAQYNPFITFAKGACADLDYTNKDAVPFADYDIEHTDTNITYKGYCYWLLPSRPKASSVQSTIKSPMDQSTES